MVIARIICAAGMLAAACPVAAKSLFAPAPAPVEQAIATPAEQPKTVATPAPPPPSEPVAPAQNAAEILVEKPKIEPNPAQPRLL